MTRFFQCTATLLWLLMSQAASSQPIGGGASGAAPQETPAASPPMLVSRPEAPRPTPVGMSLNTEAVFSPGKTKLDPEEEARLDALVKKLLDGGFGGILLDGYANENGTAPSRMAIAAKRAETLKMFMVVRGLPHEKIVTRGLPERTWEAPAECKAGAASRKNPACTNPGSPVVITITGSGY